MSARRSYMCLGCRARQATTGRRLRSIPEIRSLSTLTSRLASNEAVITFTALEGPNEENRTTSSVSRSVEAQNTGLCVGEVREALLTLEALWRGRDMRVKVLRSLSNPFPGPLDAGNHSERHTPRPILPKPKAEPVSLADFRQSLKEAASTKSIRQALRARFLQCEWPREILQVIAVAMQKDTTAHQLGILHEPLMRALYRCRNNVDDAEVFRTLDTVVSRYRVQGLCVNPQLVTLGLKFAARSRSLKGMKKYLKALKEKGSSMSSHVFRSVIAKFSIGSRGLGEIRNGRWKRDELLQVLTGFDDTKHLPPAQQYHLGTWLERDNWHFLHGWVAVLSRCKASDAIWQEWELWKQNEARTRPKNLASMHKRITTKVRGDYWFVEQMAFSGGAKHGWQMLRESGINFTTLKDPVKMFLLDGVEYAGTLWNDDVRHELVRKYDAELKKIERALGISWVPKGTLGDDPGHHVHLEEQETVLERLGSVEWRLENDYGYPYETSPIILGEERSLHDAAETTPAEVLSDSTAL